MPAQKAADDLWSHVYTIQLRTCFPANETTQASQKPCQGSGSKHHWARSDAGQDIRFGAVSSIAAVNLLVSLLTLVPISG